MCIFILLCESEENIRVPRTTMAEHNHRIKMTTSSSIHADSLRINIQIIPISSQAVPDISHCGSPGLKMMEKDPDGPWNHDNVENDDAVDKEFEEEK